MPIPLRKLSLVAAAVVLFNSILNVTVSGQCTASGPLSPATTFTSNYPGSNFSFSDPGNISSSDNSRATAAGLVSLFVGNTDYLEATNFGFAIPTSAIICGIQVDIEKSATGIGNILALESYVTDNYVQLIKNGSITATDKATATHWNGTDNYYSYGGSSDLWGNTWLPADINAADFGIAFAASINGLASLIPSVRIDHIRITVYYLDIVLPVHLLNFEVTANKNNTVSLNWTTDPQSEPAIYDIERSQDGKIWETIPAITSGHTGSYTGIDDYPYTGKSWYRLKMIYAGGKVAWSENRSVQLSGVQPAVTVYPNPFTSFIQITGILPGARLILLDAYGRIVKKITHRGSSNLLWIELAGLSTGFYYLAIGGKRMKIQKL